MPARAGSAAAIRGAVQTRQGRVRVLESFDRRNDPRDRHYYWMVSERMEDEAEAGAAVHGHEPVSENHCRGVGHRIVEHARASLFFDESVL